MKSFIAFAINLVGMLLIYSLMANAITRYYWRGLGTVGVLGTITAAGLFWVLPPFVLFLIFYELHLGAHALWFGNWLVSGFSVIVLCQAVRWIPRQLEDSARLDGFGWFGIYRRVVLPLIGRELALIALLIVMATSPIFWPVLTASIGGPPLWLLLLPIGSEGGPILFMMTAGSIIMTLPVMVIFFLSQRWFPPPREARKRIANAPQRLPVASI